MILDDDSVVNRWQKNIVPGSNASNNAFDQETAEYDRLYGPKQQKRGDAPVSSGSSAGVGKKIELIHLLYKESQEKTGVFKGLSDEAITARYHAIWRRLVDMSEQCTPSTTIEGVLHSLENPPPHKKGVLRTIADKFTADANPNKPHRGYKRFFPWMD